MGFKDTLLQLWDINDQKKPVWQARNLPNDELDLQIPIYDTDICHLNEHLICVTTGYGDVRDYDTRGQRRPLNSVKVTKDKE